MNIIKRGAEAVLYKEGEELVKDRIKKSYRINEIDDPLRKQRTKGEARLLSEARRAGVPAPKVFSIEDHKIKMEFIDGTRIKELIYDEKSDKGAIAEEIGRSVGLLHSHGIVHGDLTTSNMITREGKIYFIDFGLGSQTRRTEDFGIDLSVFKEAVKSTHIQHLDLIWERFINGYRQTNSNWKLILNALESIEQRGRYIRR